MTQGNFRTKLVIEISKTPLTMTRSHAKRGYEIEARIITSGLIFIGLIGGNFWDVGFD